MTSEELIQAAADSLEVAVVRPLRAGGQKTVMLVKRVTDELGGPEAPAEDDSQGEELVLKVISIDSSSPDALRRAQREVELLERLDHPNVVKAASELVELGDPLEGVAWLEEYLDGDDLSDLLGEDQWDWPEAHRMAIDVARGLSALHDENVVHRDLSAANVRRRSSGSFVVMDPGYARHIGRSSLTVGGQPGTPGFLSPEHIQAYSGAPTAASDVFCLGILIQYALTARLPIPFAEDPGDYIRRLAEVDIEDLSSARPDLTDEVVGFVKRCLHPQPARRFRTGARAADALQALR